MLHVLILIMYIQPVVECYSAFVGNRTKELENIDWVQPMVEFVGIFSRWQQYLVNAFCAAKIRQHSTCG